MAENEAGSKTSVFHDLLHDIQNIDLPPGDNGNYQDYDEAAEFFRGHDQFVGMELADPSNAGSNDYLDYGRYINQTLSTYSIPCPYTGPIDFDFKTVQSRVKVVNTLLELLNQRGQSKDFILEAEEVIKDLQTRKRDAEQRSQTVRKEFALQKKNISDLIRKMRLNEQDARKRKAALNEKLRKAKSQKHLQKQYLAQTIADSRKRDDNIRELRLKAMGQIDQHEKRMKVHLGMKPINDEMVLRRRQRARNDRKDREEYEHIKRELQSHTEKVNELTTENQQLKQKLMTLKLEVKLLGERNGDGAYEDLPMEKLDINPHLFEMPYDMVRNFVKAETRKDLKAFREKRERKLAEGSTRSMISSARGVGENPEGPIPSHINRSRGTKAQSKIHFTEALENVPDINVSFESLLDDQALISSRSIDMRGNRIYDSFSDMKSDF